MSLRKKDIVPDLSVEGYIPAPALRNNLIPLTVVSHPDPDTEGQQMQLVAGAIQKVKELDPLIASQFIYTDRDVINHSFLDEERQPILTESLLNDLGRKEDEFITPELFSITDILEGRKKLTDYKVTWYLPERPHIIKAEKLDTEKASFKRLDTLLYHPIISSALNYTIPSNTETQDAEKVMTEERQKLLTNGGYFIMGNITKRKLNRVPTVDSSEITHVPTSNTLINTNSWEVLMEKEDTREEEDDIDETPEIPYEVQEELKKMLHKKTETAKIIPPTVPEVEEEPPAHPTVPEVEEEPPAPPTDKLPITGDHIVDFKNNIYKYNACTYKNPQGITKNVQPSDLYRTFFKPSEKSAMYGHKIRGVEVAKNQFTLLNNIQHHIEDSSRPLFNYAGEEGENIPINSLAMDINKFRNLDPDNDELNSELQLKMLEMTGLPKFEREKLQRELNTIADKFLRAEKVLSDDPDNTEEVRKAYNRSLWDFNQKIIPLIVENYIQKATENRNNACQLVTALRKMQEGEGWHFRLPTDNFLSPAKLSEILTKVTTQSSITIPAGYQSFLKPAEMENSPMAQATQALNHKAELLDYCYNPMNPKSCLIKNKYNALGLYQPMRKTADGKNISIPSSSWLESSGTARIFPFMDLIGRFWRTATDQEDTKVFNAVGNALKDAGIQHHDSMNDIVSFKNLNTFLEKSGYPLLSYDDGVPFVKLKGMGEDGEESDFVTFPKYDIGTCQPHLSQYSVLINMDEELIPYQKELPNGRIQRKKISNLMKEYGKPEGWKWLCAAKQDQPKLHIIDEFKQRRALNIDRQHNIGTETLNLAKSIGNDAIANAIQDFGIAMHNKLVQSVFMDIVEGDYGEEITNPDDGEFILFLNELEPDVANELSEKRLVYNVLKTEKEKDYIKAKKEHGEAFEKLNKMLQKRQEIYDTEENFEHLQTILQSGAINALAEFDVQSNHYKPMQNQNTSGGSLNYIQRRKNINADTFGLSKANTGKSVYGIETDLQEMFDYTKDVYRLPDPELTEPTEPEKTEHRMGEIREGEGPLGIPLT